MVAGGRALQETGIDCAALEGKAVGAHRHEAFFRQVLEGESLRGEWEQFGRWYQVHGTPLRDSSGDIVAALAIACDISRQKEAELASASSERLRQVLNAMHEGYYCLDSEWRFVEANAEAERHFGVQAGGLIGLNIWELAAVAEDSPIRRKFMQAAATGQAAEFEAKSEVRPAYWALLNLYPRGDLLDVYFHDISKRKEAEAKLNQTHAQLKSLVAQAPAGLAFFDPELRYVLVNERLAEMNGIPAEAHPGKRVRDVVPSLMPVLEKAVEEILATGQAVKNREFVGASPTAPGETWYWNESWYPIRDETGDIIGLGSIVEDITERKRVENLLESERRLLQTIIDNIPVMLCIWDSHLQQFTFNRQFRAVFGWTEADADEGDFMAKVYPDPAYRLEVARFMQSLETGWRDFKTTAKDGSEVETVWANVHLEGDSFVGIGLDMRERKQHEDALRVAYKEVQRQAEELELQAEELASINVALSEREAQLKRANEELARSNRELEQFAYVASHDLQEPLRQVVNFSELLEKRFGKVLDKEGCELLDFIMEGGQRMQAFIKDLLTFSRAGHSGQKEPTSVQHILDTAVTNLRARIEEAGALISVEPLPTLEVVPQQMMQVFQNLIGNALKFRSQAPLEIQIGARKAENEWHIWVKDNGIGFDMEHAERVFQIFHRLHKRSVHAGTGIGLPICKRVIEQHGGRIWAESTVGEGSTFHFTLPAPKEEPGENESAREPRQES